MFISIQKVIENSGFIVYHIICDDYKISSLMKLDKNKNHWVTTKQVVPTRVAMAAKTKILRFLKNKGEYPIQTIWSS